MGHMFNPNVINNIFHIEEKILDSVRKISKLNDFSDIDYYFEEIEKIKLFYAKEKFLISKIPSDADFYSYLFESIDNVSFDLIDKNLILSRFRNILYNNYLLLKFEDDKDNTLYDDVFDDELYELKAKLFIRDNLVTEYLKSFDQPMKYSDDKSFSIFNNIRLYNIFLNINLFDFWIKSGFDFDKISYCTDEQAINHLKLSKEDYYYLLNETISENCVSLLTGVFSDVDRPKYNIIVQDSFFNFKFLLKKLTTESIKAIKKEMDSVYSSVGKYGLLPDIIKMLDSELDGREFVDSSCDRENKCVDSTIFDKIVNLVKLEDNIYDLFNEIDFSSSNNDLTKLGNFVLLEKDLVKDIPFSSSLVTYLNDLFNDNLWLYLNDATDEKSFFISYRITNLLPFYKNLKICPSQKEDSYIFIYRNHLIRSLRDLWELRCESNNSKIKNGFESIYRFYYFINPCLTDELIYLNGNHSLIFDLSSDLSGLDNLEYEYDKDEQLFNLGCEIISFIFDNEDCINTVLDYSVFQFKINELMDVISNLSISYNKKLYKYLVDYSSFFSPLRRDLRKIFKDEFKSDKIKSNIKK